MKRSTALLLSLVLFGCGKSAPAEKPAPSTPAGPQPQSLETTQLRIGAKTFTLQVADTNDRRETGLMYVRSMPADRGMIFLFPAERVLAFWMHNTPIDLDIIYADHAGRVTAVKTMHAFDESSVSSEDPADVAIELNSGEAAKTGVKTGDKLDIPDSLRSRAR